MTHISLQQGNNVRFHLGGKTLQILKREGEHAHAVHLKHGRRRKEGKTTGTNMRFGSTTLGFHDNYKAPL